jgi:hypothetical protein
MFPTVKFSVTISLRATSRRAISCAFGFDRSSARLLRDMFMEWKIPDKFGPTTPLVPVRNRTRSGARMLSTRMTSAPIAPSHAVACGTAKIHPKSSTRIPSNGNRTIR